MLCLRGSTPDTAGAYSATPAGKRWVTPLQRAPQNCGPQGSEFPQSATGCNRAIFSVQLNKMCSYINLVTTQCSCVNQKVKISTDNCSYPEVSFCKRSCYGIFILKSYASWLECFPEKPSWCRNEHVCQGRQKV